jgi:hypothetical protein
MTFASNILGTDIKCEADFIVMTKATRGQSQIILAECKNNKPIEEQDLINLAKVAEIFPEDKFETYILLAKFNDFTNDELKLINKFQGKYRNRIIIWSARELEPYHVYEGVKDFQHYGNQLKDLAQATKLTYFDQIKN